MRGANDAGVALILAMLTAVLLSALGSSLLLVADLERLAAANAGFGAEALAAAEAGAERAIVDVRRAADWTAVLNGTAASSFAGPGGAVRLPAGGALDLGVRTADLQAQTWPPSAFGANTPRWRLYGWGALSELTSGRADSLQYVATWVADDPADADGNPAADTNGTILLHAESRGPGGARRMIEVTMARVPGGGVRVLTWREVR